MQDSRDIRTCFLTTVKWRRIWGLLPIIIFVLGLEGSVVAQTSPSAAVKNVVLVHGGFVDGSGWEGVYKILKKDGYTVAVVQNPTISLADDVAVTRRTIASQNGPVTFLSNNFRKQRHPQRPSAPANRSEAPSLHEASD